MVKLCSSSTQSSQTHFLCYYLSSSLAAESLHLTTKALLPSWPASILLVLFFWYQKQVPVVLVYDWRAGSFCTSFSRQNTSPPHPEKIRRHALFSRSNSCQKKEAEPCTKAFETGSATFVWSTVVSRCRGVFIRVGEQRTETIYNQVRSAHHHHDFILLLCLILVSVHSCMHHDWSCLVSPWWYDSHRSVGCKQI